MWTTPTIIELGGVQLGRNVFADRPVVVNRWQRPTSPHEFFFGGENSGKSYASALYSQREFENISDLIGININPWDTHNRVGHILYSDQINEDFGTTIASLNLDSSDLPVITIELQLGLRYDGELLSLLVPVYEWARRTNKRVLLTIEDVGSLVANRPSLGEWFVQACRQSRQEGGVAFRFISQPSPWFLNASTHSPDAAGFEMAAECGLILAFHTNLTDQQTARFGFTSAEAAFIRKATRIFQPGGWNEALLEVRDRGKVPLWIEATDTEHQRIKTIHCEQGGDKQVNQSLVAEQADREISDHFNS